MANQFVPNQAECELTAERAAEISAQCAAEKHSLGQLAAAMESEFLELGSLLRKIMLLSREVRQHTDKIMASASATDEDFAIQFAFQLLKKAEDLVQASREQHDRVFSVFQNMQSDLIQVSKAGESLMDALAPLSTTNVQFRIQAAVFDDATRRQFFGLADSIASIIKEVKTAVSQSFEDLERTGQSTGELISQLAGMASGQHGETERLLSESRDHLSSVNDALRNSGQLAQTVAQAGSRISGGVSQAIVALQCQDMAQQKFQHIAAAIDDMVAHLDSAFAVCNSDSDLPAGRERDCRIFLASAARIQRSQLDTVFTQLDQAAGQISMGLNQVDAEAKVLSQHAVHSGSSMLDGQVIGRAIKSIHSVLGVIEKAVDGIRRATSLVQQLKSTFSDTTTQTVELAKSLRLVALNAQIFAIQVDKGSALEVVARNTRSIAGEAMQQLHEISSRINVLVNSVVDLEQRLSDYCQLADLERGVLSAEADEAEDKLHSLEQQLHGAVSEIEPLERGLSETFIRAAQCIGFPKLIAESRSRTTGFFENLVSQYAEPGDDGTSEIQGKVQELKRHYTMENERTVHDSAFAPATAVQNEMDDENLAANVELF